MELEGFEPSSGDVVPKLSTGLVSHLFENNAGCESDQHYPGLAKYYLQSANAIKNAYAFDVSDSNPA